MLDRARERCQYLLGPDVDGKYICSITEDKVGSGQPLAAMLQVIPKQQLQYWKEECQAFPDPESFIHLDLHEAAPSCTYRFEEV